VVEASLVLSSLYQYQDNKFQEIFIISVLELIMVKNGAVFGCMGLYF